MKIETKFADAVAKGNVLTVKGYPFVEGDFAFAYQQVGDDFEIVAVYHPYFAWDSRWDDLPRYFGSPAEVEAAAKQWVDDNDNWHDFHAWVAENGDLLPAYR